MRARHTEKPDSSLARLVLFSDAVFAIAITLLAVDVNVPVVEPQQLSGALRDLVPSIATFALTFVVIGLYWMNHHRMFQAIVRFDYTLAWLNLLVLLGVAVLPVSNALLSGYPSSPYAVLFYATTLSCTSLASALLWCYASTRHRLVASHVGTQDIRAIFRRPLTTILVAFLALGLGFINTTSAFTLLVLYALTLALTWVLGSRLEAGS
jgi:uncharacterized membrane protein